MSFDQKIGTNHPWADKPGIRNQIGTGVSKGERSQTRAIAAVVSAAPPQAVVLRYSNLKTGLRPANEFSVEEMRIQLAAQAGPMRMFTATSNRVDLQQNVAKLLSHGTHAVQYVRVDAILGSPSIRFIFSTGQKGSPDTAPSFILPDEGPQDFILLPGDDLFGFTDAVGGGSLKVFEVIV
jgi:hypothetical protein